MTRLIFSSLCLSAAVFGVFTGYKKLTKGFRYPKIYAKLAPKTSWSVETFTPSKKEEIEKILSQSFSFLDRGTQFYVFSSEDGKYVLKFFRFDRMKPPFWMEKLSSIFPKVSKEQRKTYVDRVDHTMQACIMAYERLKKQTGLVYLHLNPTKELQRKVMLIDGLGRSRSIDLNELSFVLQKKLEPLKSVMKRARDTKDSAWQQSIIRSFFTLLIERSRANICNTDPDVFHNFGYLDNEVVEIDFGDYFEDPKLRRPFIFDVEIDKYAKAFRKWLEKHIPDQVGFFDQTRKKAVATYSKDLA